ncbi:MAG: SDR family oxidoreductase [Chloroflexota bacterium]|nr:SDR family oxidoreductase [Chloroflexota bacterium]
MKMGLKGAVALVAASSEGMGRAIALGLAEEGADIAMCARRADVLEEAANLVRGMSGVEVLAIPADMAKEEDIKRVVSTAREHFGRIDVLVNNAGGPPHGEFAQHGEEEWQRAFELNLLSAVRLVREALPYLKASGRGRIINLTSTSVKQPIEGLILSNAIRVGVIGMAKTLAVELAPYGITVNSIAPGRIDTARIRDLDHARAEVLGVTEAEARKMAMAQIPLGRYGTPEEVANLAVFLASDKASYITGTTIQVDGGMVKSIL